ncbi:MAG: DUF805 domain-containing protein [Micrococcales bacterium]
MANKVNFAQAIALGFKNYVRFRGTASRSEYWYFLLFVFLLSLVLSTFDSLLQANAGVVLPITLSAIASYGLVLPQLTLQVRRFRDAGLNPWLQLLQVIPLVLLVVGLFGFISQKGFEALATLNAIAEPTLSDIRQALDQVSPTTMGMLGAGFVLTLAWGIFAFVICVLPSKSRAQGNKHIAE